MERSNKFIRRTKPAKRRPKSVDPKNPNARNQRARRTGRYDYQAIPYSEKNIQLPNMYRLYADLVLMETDGTLITEASLYNNYKAYKHAEIDDYSNQKFIRFQLEDKESDLEDWKTIVEKIRNSESSTVRAFAEPVKQYCERYEAVLDEYLQEISGEKVERLREMNAQNEKIRQTIIRTFPCLEFKSQLKDGRIQLTEESFSEKYLTELGYTIEEFTTMVFQDGMPIVVALDGRGASRIANMRLEKYLTTDSAGYQTPEFDNYLIMKNGWVKKTRFIIHYLTTYEKGVPGFVFLAAMVSRQKPTLEIPKSIEGLRINEEYLELKAQRERQQAEFLSMFYGINSEKK